MELHNASRLSSELLQDHHDQHDSGRLPGLGSRNWPLQLRGRSSVLRCIRFHEPSLNRASNSSNTLICRLTKCVTVYGFPVTTMQPLIARRAAKNCLGPVNNCFLGRSGQSKQVHKIRLLEVLSNAWQSARLTKHFVRVVLALAMGLCDDDISMSDWGPLPSVPSHDLLVACEAWRRLKRQGAGFLVRRRRNGRLTT